MVIAEDVSFFAGFLTGRANVGGVAVAEAKSAAAVTTEAAVNLANQKQSLSNATRPGAAGAVQAATGEMFTATSGRGGVNSKVQTMLNNVPKDMRSRTHGACCEPKLISQMLDAGVNPKGATFSVVRIRAPGKPLHATPLDSCSTCTLLLNAINK